MRIQAKYSTPSSAIQCFSVPITVTQLRFSSMLLKGKREGHALQSTPTQQQALKTGRSRMRASVETGSPPAYEKGAPSHKR